MPESCPPAGDDDAALLALLDTVPRLRAEGRFDEFRKAMHFVLDRRHGRPEVLHKLIYTTACFHDHTPLVRDLIIEYQALQPDIAQYPITLLIPIALTAKLCGRWALAANAYAQIINRRGIFQLNDYMDLAEAVYSDGRVAQASAVAQRAEACTNDLIAEMRRELGPERASGLVVPVGEPYAIAHAIGEMCIQFDLFLKAAALGWLDRRNRAFIVDDAAVCNPALLGYWREKVRVIDSSALAAERQRSLVLEQCTHSLRFMTVPGLGGSFRNAAYPLLNEVWHDQGRPPVLALKDQHREGGRRLLAELGCGAGDWFVGVHVRENGWLGDSPGGHNAVRSGNIADYLPMIREITGRGGWVVRLGDPTMTPLPAMPRVFDYALSPHKSDWMDIFLAAAARFVVGTQSGLHTLPTVFGTPVVLTNYLPADGYWVGPGDIVIHKTIRSRQNNRRLTIRETFTRPVTCQGHRYFYEDNQLEPLSNSPEEITDACRQMLATLEGRDAPTADDLELLERYRRHANHCGRPFRHAIGRLFLRNIRDLLAEP